MLKIIADLHLAKGVPQKTMEIFGDAWLGYMDRIHDAWSRNVSEKDIVLIPGDISWASDLQEFKTDLSFLADLPGKKVFIRGNHDYWSSASYKKISAILPKDCFFIKNNCFLLPEASVAITGARLWNSESIVTDSRLFNDDHGDTDERHIRRDSLEDRKIFLRELDRLELGLKSIPENFERRIVMTHFPPISSDGTSGPVSDMLEKYNVEVCFFGHLHGIKSVFRKEKPIFGKIGRVDYRLTSADFLNFNPLEYPLSL